MTESRLKRKEIYVIFNSKSIPSWKKLSGYLNNVCAIFTLAIKRFQKTCHCCLLHGSLLQRICC